MNAGGIAFALAIPAVYQEYQPPVFRIAVEAVQVDVYVGRGGKAVTGLTKDDFELFDNGVRQQLDLFNIETVPLNISLVLDTITPRSDRVWKQAQKRHAQSTKLLRELTEVTGGRFIEAEPGVSLSEAFLDILAELKTRYLLTYAPSDVAQEGWHEIRIKLKRQKGDIRARRGYFRRK